LPRDAIGRKSRSASAHENTAAENALSRKKIIRPLALGLRGRKSGRRAQLRRRKGALFLSVAHLSKKPDERAAKFI